jgi:hypothetical protein
MIAYLIDKKAEEVHSQSNTAVNIFEIQAGEKYTMQVLNSTEHLE